MHLHPAAVIFDKSQLTESIHEEADSGTCRSNHFSQRLLADLRNDDILRAHRHELGNAVHRWNVGRYRRLKQVIHRPGQRKRRGRMMRSTQVSGGSALNWSPLQTRHWADKNRMIRNTCRPEHS